MIARVNLNPQVDARKPMSRIFVHFISAVPHSTERDMNLILDMFNDALRKVVTKHASTILKLRLERIAVKVWVSPAKIPLKMIASSNADWDGDGLRETLDEKTGLGKEWLDIITQEKKSSFTMLSPIEIKLHAKRNTARNAGSTYIYDFLGLFRIALTRDWLQSDKAKEIPEKVFSAQELILNAEGNLVETNRDVAQNNVGMVVFHCELKTPAHPQGRKMILIGNDVTIKAGSFGTVEDDVFQKASQLAREKGLPRVYIACNSGARLGTVEELKSLVKVAWVDPADANKGFEYLS
jgi:acetyl-CoA carboxylase/biotin carboxylase 1